MITWIWNPVSDAAIYIVSVAIVLSAGSIPNFIDVATTPTESFTENYHPQSGECFYFNIDAVDLAGNRSE